MQHANRNKLFAIAVVGLSLFISGCTQSGSPRLRNDFATAAASYDRDATVRMTPEEFKDQFADRTMLTNSFSHGPQVSYVTADGKSYLWYGGNSVILKGDWKLETKQWKNPITKRETEAQLLCYRYGANTFNPATGRRGAEWECTLAARYLARRVQSEKGDMFGLSKSTAAPFALARSDVSFAIIKAVLNQRGQ